VMWTDSALLIQVLALPFVRRANVGVSRRAARPRRPGAADTTASQPTRFPPRGSAVGCTQG
ncbi:hypothetical protein D6779_10455, partial [Candidatus Parcubacteria bacterium]